MIEEDQTQAEAGDAGEAQGDEQEAPPGPLAAGLVAAAVDILGAAPGKEAGLFDRAWRRRA